MGSLGNFLSVFRIMILILRGKKSKVKTDFTVLFYNKCTQSKHET